MDFHGKWEKRNGKRKGRCVTFTKTTGSYFKGHNNASHPIESKQSSPRDFRDLHIWKLAKKLALEIYKLTQKHPREEIYGLSQQMRSAAVSVASNIAEGFNRRYSKEYQRFLYIALGSCGELETQVEISRDLRYAPYDSYGELLENLDHESRMIRSLIKKLDAHLK